MDMCEMIVEPPLDQRMGVPPTVLRQLASDFGKAFGIEAELVEPCAFERLEAGDLLYISSVGLINVQEGGDEFEAAEFDSHIVVVERVTRTSLTVINPDCKQVGSGFTYDSWGRMKIPASKLDSIWKTTRSDGVTTDRAAVLLRGTKKRGRHQKVHTLRTWWWWWWRWGFGGRIYLIFIHTHTHTHTHIHTYTNAG